jgi:uncharacterized membrane protein YgcG
VEKPQTFRSPTALVVWVVWLLFAVGNWVDLAVQGRDHTSVIAAAILLLATGIAYVTAQRPRVIVADTGVTIKNPVRDHEISWAAVTDVDLADLLRVHCDLDPDQGPEQSQGREQGQGPGQGNGRGEGDGKGKRQDRGKRKIVSAWAIHYSRRRQLAADTKSRRATARAAGGGRPSLLGGGFSAGGFSTGGRGTSPYGASAAASSASGSEAEAKMIVRLIKERATAARAEALWSASPPAPATTPADATTPAPAGTTSPASVAADVPATGSTRLLTSTWSTSAIAALVVPALILLIVILL